MKINNYILPSLIDDVTLSPSEIAEEIEMMRQNQSIINQYRDKIKTRKDGRQYYIIVNRKQITATSIECLYEKLWFMHYGKQNSTLTDLFPKWLIWKRDNTSISAKTLKEYSFLWNSSLKDTELANIPMKNLTVKDFTAFFRVLTKNRDISKKRFTNIKSLLNGIYSYAIEEEIVLYNPIRDVNCRQFSFKPINRKAETFTIEDRTKLLNYLDSIDGNIYALAIKLDFYLIVRIGELLALRWSDVEGNYIHVQRQHLIDISMNDDLTFSTRNYSTVNYIKGNTDQGYRYQPLTPKSLSILADIRKLNPEGEFILMQDNKQLLTDTFNEYLKKFCIEAGIQPHSSHKIRFANASILYNQGMPLSNLQQLLGHTTTAMTLHYIRSVTPADTTTNIMVSALG